MSSASSSVSASAPALTRFDHFLHGLARLNHVRYLSENWSENASTAQKVVGYAFGVGEHLLYAVWKIATIATLILVDLGLAIHYLVTKDDTSLRRLKVGVLTLSDALIGVVADAVGVVCPPAAYRIHAFFEESVTDAWCGKFQVDLVAAINHFSRMKR